MSLSVRSCWTESGNMNSHENACVLIFHLMFVVIIIGINSFSLSADTVHCGNSKSLIFECEVELSDAVLLQENAERGRRFRLKRGKDIPSPSIGKDIPSPSKGTTSTSSAASQHRVHPPPPTLRCSLAPFGPRKLAPALQAPGPAAQTACLWPRGRGQRERKERSLLLRQGRSLGKCFGSAENALFR